MYPRLEPRQHQITDRLERSRTDLSAVMVAMFTHERANGGSHIPRRNDELITDFDCDTHDNCTPFQYIPLMWYLIVALVIIVLLHWVMNRRSPVTTPSVGVSEQYPYRRKNYLLSRAERDFYLALLEATDLAVCPKVRISDFLFVAKGTKRRLAAHSKIHQKHVDFLLCRESDLRPTLAIELDDKSHQSSKAQERDHFVESALHAAEMPLLRVRATTHYDVGSLRQQIERQLRTPID